MTLLAWRTLVDVMGGDYKKRWPDDVSHIIFQTTLFAGVVNAACCLLPALPAACCLLLAARCTAQRPRLLRCTPFARPRAACVSA